MVNLTLGQPLRKREGSRLVTDNRIGRDLNAPKKYKTMLQEVGFVDVVETRLKVPIGLWGTTKLEKKIGGYTLTNYNQETFEAVSMKFLNLGLGMSVLDVKALVAEVHKDFSNPDRCLVSNW